jgi:hypothetical protein
VFYVIVSSHYCAFSLICYETSNDSNFIKHHNSNWKCLSCFVYYLITAFYYISYLKYLYILVLVKYIVNLISQRKRSRIDLGFKLHCRLMLVIIVTKTTYQLLFIFIDSSL